MSLCGVELDDLAFAHDRDAVADLEQERQVVGDEDHREPELVAQMGDLARISRWTSTSRAVVGSSMTMSCGSQRERHGDHDALAHAARQLVRVSGGAARRP